jgi:hypothetical protein
MPQLELFSRARALIVGCRSSAQCIIPDRIAPTPGAAVYVYAGPLWRRLWRRLFHFLASL